MKTVNPFYQSRPLAHEPQQTLKETVPAGYARLPQAPINQSPVPHLTSLYHFDQAEQYGKRNYPGNCGGLLIRDLLCFFQPKTVLDPMTGSGTCRDVCEDLDIACASTDIHYGFDACDPQHFFGETRLYEANSFDFVWLHPPYWRQKLYAEDPRDLSRTPTLEAFLERFTQLIRNMAAVLKPGGMLVILMGDYIDRQAGFIPLTYHTKRLALECGFQIYGTDIIRFNHGTSSSRKVYQTSFIPGLHDVCMLFQKPMT